MWQAIVVAALIVGCVVYLVRKYMPADSGSSCGHGCSHCAGCGASRCSHSACSSQSLSPPQVDEPQ